MKSCLSQIDQENTDSYFRIKAGEGTNPAYIFVTVLVLNSRSITCVIWQCSSIHSTSRQHDCKI